MFAEGLIFIGLVGVLQRPLRPVYQREREREEEGGYSSLFHGPTGARWSLRGRRGREGRMRAAAAANNARKT